FFEKSLGVCFVFIACKCWRSDQQKCEDTLHHFLDANGSAADFDALGLIHGTGFVFVATGAKLATGIVVVVSIGGTSIVIAVVGVGADGAATTFGIGCGHIANAIPSDPRMPIPIAIGIHFRFGRIGCTRVVAPHAMTGARRARLTARCAGAKGASS